MIGVIVKALLIPGSTAFLLVGLGFGVVLLYFGGRTARAGRAVLSLLFLFYLLLSLPAVSNGLIGLLETGPVVRTPADARGARVLVVIGNGVVSYRNSGLAVHQMLRRTTFNVLEGARLYRLLQPSLVIASGGIPDGASQWAPESIVIRDALVRLNVPAERIVLDSSSTNTRQQVASAVRMIRSRGIDGPVLFVTTPAHTRRVALFASNERLDAIVTPATSLRYDESRPGWQKWLPSVDALRGSESAAYEYFALAPEVATGRD